MDEERIGIASRLTAAVGAVVLFASLFLTWSFGGHADLLSLVGALNRTGGFFAAPSKSAWEVYSVADVALAVVIVAARSGRPRLLLPALIAAVAGLGFAIDQIAHPPPVVSPLPENIPVRPPAANLPICSGRLRGSAKRWRSSLSFA